MERFIEIMRPAPTDRILDVGGLPQTWHDTGLEERVTLLNLGVPADPPPPFSWRKGDACDMSMFKAGDFDIVFSNSVIEHVGDLTYARRMAAEVCRISKRYWVQTPNRHFPIEPHFMFPFFQYLPTPFRHAIARYWPFSFSRVYNLDPIFEADHIWLLSGRDMRALFPEARVLRERVFGLTKSLVAYRA